MVMFRLLFVLTTLHYVASAEFCTTGCRCCVDSLCSKPTTKVCDRGCRDGYWSDKCYNDCPANCSTCTQTSTDGGLPCTACKDGFYNGKYQDRWNYPTKNDCRQSCKTNCAACTSYNKCSRCKKGFYNGYDSSNRYYKVDCSLDCKSSCVSCTSYSQCTSCQAYTHGSNCQFSCRGNCLYCTDIDTCTVCNKGYYGSKCQYPCCNGGFCDKQSGSCGCTDGFTGTYCNECINGKYGPLCSLICSTGCQNNPCSKADGTCTCKTNFIGDKCDQCIPGNYGPTCSDSCSEGCVSGLCDINSGGCSCKVNFSDTKCDKCVTGSYGQTCSAQCGTGCLNNICRRSDGQCTCRAGFDGNKCESCVNGKHGSMCSETCSSGCRDGACNRDRGHCSCKSGFKGDKCDQCSSTTKYGPDCKQDCPNNCKSCSSITECAACYAGYYNDVNSNDCSNKCPDKCVSCSSVTDCKLCKSGYYGHDCQDKCSNGCFNDQCDKDTGICITCKSGFTGGGKCDQCAAGKYGTGCNIDCKSANCKSCHRDTGLCTTCNEQWYGESCSIECAETCENKQCYFNGTCVSCVPGYRGPMCNASCPSNCLKCSSMTSCSDCKPGYYGTICNGTCPENCTTCSSINNCLTCKVWHKGVTCQDTCPKCKYNTTCDKNTGYCNEACVEGKSGTNCGSFCYTKCKACQRYSDSKCNECATGRYGYYSSQGYYTCGYSCPYNCKDEECDGQTGNCLACTDGYKGDKCNCPDTCNTCKPDGACIDCEAGFTNANKDCTCRRDMCINDECDNCKNTTWYAEAGSSFAYCCKCNVNCKDGECLSEKQCEDGCEEGYYKQDCSAKCSKDDDQCLKCEDNENGIYKSCLRCQEGYFPDPSNKRCIKCKSSCLNSKCDSDNGTCLEGCDNVYWGLRCESRCQSNCLTCSRLNGACDVCANGRHGTDCSIPCSTYCKKSDQDYSLCKIENGDCYLGCASSTKHGPQCARKCSTNCVNHECDWLTGYCNACTMNKFGYQCDNSCSVNCLMNNSTDTIFLCSGVNGTCLHGCVFGFYGKACENTCSPNCQTAICDRSDGHCDSGCKTGFTGASCMQAMHQDDEDDETSGAAIGGAVGGAIVLLALVVLLIVVVSRKRKSKPVKSETIENQDNELLQDTGATYSNISGSVNVTTKPDRPSQCPSSSKRRQDLSRVKSNISILSNEELDSEYVADDVTNDESGECYYNIDAIKKGIPVAKLAEQVSLKQKDDFKIEFKEFHNGLVRPHLDSQKPENKSRNRYQHIYPYDENRVRLTGNGSDYINASFIDGYNAPKAYIACLGPLIKTTDNFAIFWTMVWQQNIEKIAMVTNLFEEGGMKCEQYWPNPGTSTSYGDVTVTCNSEDVYADYTLRSFKVTQNSDTRSIHHMHYTAWPDKGVPDDVTSIIEFRQRVISIPTPLNGPTVVHCSAGVGRTGTYIGLDKLTREGQDTKSVDIFGCVVKMREQRVNMVQTADQYQYLHNAVVHSLTYDCQPIQGENFQQHLKTLDDTTLSTKFQLLQTTHEKKSEDEQKAIDRNRQLPNLNRQHADIPGDYRRPKLYLHRDNDASDYINAVYLNSFKTKNHYIVAMTPLPGTVWDFLTLIYQTNCSCIVSMESLETLNDKTIGAYYPADNQTLELGPYTFTCSRGSTSEGHVMRKLTMTHQGPSETTERIIHHFQLTKWPRNHVVPSNTVAMLQLIHDVETNTKNIDDKGPVLIHCLNGAGRAGLFCAVSVLIQKMEIDHEVSVVNVIRQIKSRRGLAIPNKEQYLYCHQCVGAYLESFDSDIYSNFTLQ